MVYSWNGKVLIPLERNQAVEHKSGSTQYWEMPAPQSRVRLNEASSLVFVVRLPKGVDPASYSLFPLVTVNGSRRTRSQPGRRGGLVTWPVDIEKNDEIQLNHLCLNRQGSAYWRVLLQSLQLERRLLLRRRSLRARPITRPPACATMRGPVKLGIADALKPPVAANRTPGDQNNPEVRKQAKLGTRAGSPGPGRLIE